MVDDSAIRWSRISDPVLGVFISEPPAWTRLEPQSISGDPAPGLEARLHDPLWLLGRQWQLGEFDGEDAGTPVAIHVTSKTSPVVAWQAGDLSPDRPVQPLMAGTLVDAVVEQEAAPVSRPGLRQRAEAGWLFILMAEDTGIPVDRASVLDACPIEFIPDKDDPAPSAPHLHAIFGGRVPDGETMAAQLEAAFASAPPGLPLWLSGLPGVEAVARDWLSWYRDAVSSLRTAEDDSWIEDRLEYRFSLVVGSAEGATVLTAPAFGGGKIDWYAFDHAPDVTFAADEPTATSTQRTLHATPLQFAGMPADRYWQFEDGFVNLDALEVEPNDLARLMLVEYSMVYGNDWFVVPLDLPLGSFTTLVDVSYTTTFGERFAVSQADDTSRAGRFRMFEISQQGAATTTDGLLIPPTFIGPMEGKPLEEVLFLRDEMANMCWAVERIVEGRSGDPRHRSDEPTPPAFEHLGESEAELQYLLATTVPKNWIPMVPYADGLRSIALCKGFMLDENDEPIEPLGTLLRPGKGMKIHDEEVPREGVRVQRVPQLARQPDGTWARWVARRATVGHGEGASHLAFDSAIPRSGTT